MGEGESLSGRAVFCELRISSMSVADLLVPNPYPLNVQSASMVDLSVTNLAVTGSINASSFPNNFTQPITVTSTTSSQFRAACPDGSFVGVSLSAATFTNGNGGLFINTGAPPIMDVYGGPSTGLKLSTNGINRIIIPAGGILTDQNSTRALMLDGTDQLVIKTISSASTYTPAWTTLVGFTAGPTATQGRYIRNGNMVQVTATISGMTSGAGPTSAGTISLPFAPAALFINTSELTGVATMGVGANNASIGATLAGFTATIAVLSGGVISGDINVSFMYAIL